MIFPDLGMTSTGTWMNSGDDGEESMGREDKIGAGENGEDERRGSEERNSRTKEFASRDSQALGFGRAIGESGWWEVNSLRIGRFRLGD